MERLKSIVPDGEIGLFLFGVALLGSAVVYFIPSMVASHRKHPQFAPIFVVNLMLGWTYVGYVVALAWAVSVVRRNGQ
jgi:hypothetical protein